MTFWGACPWEGKTQQICPCLFAVWSPLLAPPACSQSSHGAPCCSPPCVPPHPPAAALRSLTFLGWLSFIRTALHRHACVPLPGVWKGGKEGMECLTGMECQEGAWRGSLRTLLSPLYLLPHSASSLWPPLHYLDSEFKIKISSFTCKFLKISQVLKEFLLSFHLPWSLCCILNEFEHSLLHKRERIYWMQCLPHESLSNQADLKVYISLNGICKLFSSLPRQSWQYENASICWKLMDLSC